MSQKDFIINRIFIKRVIVEKHSDISLELVKALHKIIIIPEDINWPYEYFVTLFRDGRKKYKVVWYLKKIKTILEL